MGVIGRQSRSAWGARRSVLPTSARRDLTDDISLEVRPPRAPRPALAESGRDRAEQEGRTDPAWVYWKARALAAGNPREAQQAESRQLLESIASVRGFYEQLALEELGRQITVPAAPAALTAEEKESARLNPSLNRGLYAITIGLRSEGVREWNYATNLARPGGMAERELLAAAQFACDREVWDRCINTSERTKTELMRSSASMPSATPGAPQPQIRLDGGVYCPSARKAVHHGRPSHLGASG